MSQLESSITVVDSPVRKRAGAKTKRRAYRQLTGTPIPVTPNKSFLNQSFSIQVVESELLQLDEDLTGQISEISTQQSCTGVAGASTRSRSKRVAPAEVEGASGTGSCDIEYEESESVGSHARIFQKSVGDEGGPTSSGDVGRTSEKKSLLESFKRIKTKYDSKVRVFGHDFRNGKYEDVVSMNLVIRNVAERQDKLLKTVAYDLAEESFKWVLFKCSDPYEIVEGVCIKLFMPWQEIIIEGNPEPLIMGVDFYKIYRSLDFNVSKQKIREILNLAVPSPCGISTLEPPLMNLVPYHLKNSNTLFKPLLRCKSCIDIDVIVLNVWKCSAPETPVLCLIKDSDDFVTFLEVPQHFEDLISQLNPEKYFKLKSVAVNKKIQISEQVAPFSVIRSFGAKQNFFVNLKMDQVSHWESVDKLDITMSYPRQTFLTMEEIDLASVFLDCRITLKCTLKERGCRHVLVSDLDSDRSLMIEMILGNRDVISTDIPLEINGKLIFNFLRLVQGKAIWDLYTTCEELSEEDWISDD